MTITLTREEAHQVLDALEEVTKQMLLVRDELAERGARPVTNTHHQKLWDSAFEAYVDHALPTAETLRARLSAPEPEPVAWTVGGLITDFSRDFSAYKTKTYTRPLYTAPPQREWQGLTDAEAEQIVDDYWHDVDMFIEAIEAKLKEKNR